MTRADAIVRWVRGPSVLDVGCTGGSPRIGSRYWLHGQLRERFPHVVGIDIAEGDIRRLREEGFDNVHVSDAEAFGLGERFDSIVAGELVEHLSNPGLFLQRAKEHLKPEGLLVITTPNVFSFLHMAYAVLKYPRTCCNLEHTCWFCPTTFRTLARRMGFKLVHQDLIEDYFAEERAAKLYSLLVRLRFLIPLRLRRNAMLFVMKAEAGT